MNKSGCRYWVLLLAFAATSSEAVTYTTTGFASLVAGKVTSGTPGTAGSVDPGIDGGTCPCAVGNWADVGIYNRSLNLKPESRAGIQENINFDSGLSFVGELTARAVPNTYGDVVPDWLYAGYAITPSWTVQMGRKRLPLFMYSDYIDIGYDYPWMRPPGDLYSWQIDHYNGANLLYNNTIADIAFTWNTWVGGEHDRNNEELKRLYYDAPANNYGSGITIDENWYNMLGTYLDFSKDWWDVRLIYMQNQVSRTQAGNPAYVLDSSNHQKFKGISVNFDPGNLVVRTEFNEFLRPTNQDYYHTSLMSMGYRIGNWLPLLTYSEFHEDFLTNPGSAESHFTRTATIRWDFRRGMDMKIQYDQLVDHSHWPFIGSTKLITVGLDAVF